MGARLRQLLISRGALMPDTGLQESLERQSFRLKVEHLEALAAQPNRGQAYIPASIAAFTAWVDPLLGFGSWSSPNIVAPSGRHSDLRRRLDEALRCLNKQADKPPGGRRGRPVAHSQALREVQKLAAQNAALLNEKMELNAAVARLRDSLRIMQDRERHLVDQLNSILPFDRQLRSISPE